MRTYKFLSMPGLKIKGLILLIDPNGVLQEQIEGELKNKVSGGMLCNEDSWF